jgi:hypothetical protein
MDYLRAPCRVLLLAERGFATTVTFTRATTGKCISFRDTEENRIKLIDDPVRNCQRQEGVRSCRY